MTNPAEQDTCSISYDIVPEGQADGLAYLGRQGSFRCMARCFLLIYVPAFES